MYKEHKTRSSNRLAVVATQLLNEIIGIFQELKEEERRDKIGPPTTIQKIITQNNIWGHTSLPFYGRLN